MELRINIPDNYDLSKIQNGSIASKILLNAVANGTPVLTGHWMTTNKYWEGAYDLLECSCCHGDSLEQGNYCPNCGARMEG